MRVAEQDVATAVGVKSQERVAGLDGLRAVAVLAVMLFHTAGTPLKGGFLGVDVFFVLSGFLIAGILIHESRLRGTIALGHFWLRRARRLAPALLLLLSVVGLARLAVIHPSADTWRVDMIAALSYTTNWFQILSGADYFTQFGQPQPLMHTWSLAIEEQFYLIFALFVAIVLNRVSTRRFVWVLLILIVASASWMSLLAESDPVWAYYGTGTRIQALLVGAVLAVVVRRSSGGAGLPRSSGAVGTVGAIVLVAAMVLPLSNTVMYRGGFLVVALASAAVIWGILTGGWLARSLSWRPLVAIGTISYGVYLWHWPIFMVLGSDRATSALAQRVWAFVLTLVVATLSYWTVERPIRRGRFTDLRPSRQWAVYAAAAAVVTTMAMLPARTASPDSPVRWPAAPETAQRIMIGGDSTMLHLFKFFPRDRYPEITIDGPLSVGCGVVDVPYLRNGVYSSPEECQGWASYWRQEVEALNPTAAVIGSTVWDSFDRVVAGRSYEPGTPEFDQAFVAGFRDAIGLAGRSGEVPVFVVGQPCMSSRVDEVLADPHRSEEIDKLIREAVSAMPNAHYLDTRRVTCTSDGRAVEVVGDDRLRVDGVHWSQRGADVFWSATLSRIFAHGLQ